MSLGGINGQLSPVAQAAIEDLSKGGDLSSVGEAAGISVSSLNGQDQESESVEQDTTDPIETIGKDQGETETSQVEAKGKQTKDSSKDVESANKEEIFVTDHQGVRRKVTIDYSNKSAVKKAYELAAGARKWQAERDQLSRDLKPAQEKAKHFDTLNQAYEKGGLKGLIETVEGKEAFKALIDAEIARREQYESATPSERRAMEIEQAKKEAEARAQEYEQKLKAIEESTNAKLEAVEVRNAQSFVDRVFDKYRFEGSLGDPEKETQLDELVWTKAQKAFEQYPDDQEIPASIVEQEFKKAAMSVRKLIGGMAEKQTEKIIANKKKATAENVQKKTMQGYKSNSNADEAKKLVRKGDMMSLLTNWDKYKDLF